MIPPPCTIDAMISSITVYSSAHDCVVSHVTNEGYKELKVVFLINVKKRYIEILNKEDVPVADKLGSSSCSSCVCSLLLR